jgi:aquaporin TIP
MQREFAAEFIGTFALVSAVCGAALFSAPTAGLVAVAFAVGLSVLAMAFAVGHISGGHLNPAVTIGFWVTKKLSTVDSLLYWAAQLLGGIAAAYLLAALLPESVWRPVALGTPDLAADFTRTAGIVLEAVLTFLLVFVVFATAADPKGAFNKIAGFAIGLTVTMDILLGGPFTGASMNPARSLGPALASHHWQNHGVYWVGPLLGGVIAGWLYNAVFLRES